jgi:hypothetical protein
MQEAEPDPAFDCSFGQAELSSNCSISHIPEVRKLNAFAFASWKMSQKFDDFTARSTGEERVLWAVDEVRFTTLRTGSLGATGLRTNQVDAPAVSPKAQIRCERTPAWIKSRWVAPEFLEHRLDHIVNLDCITKNPSRRACDDRSELAKHIGVRLLDSS